MTDSITIRIKGNEIHLTEDGDYRPEHLIINGEIASMEAYAAAHDGKNWRATSSGNILMYRTESGKEYDIPQGRLQSRFQDHLREAINATGLSQRAFAEAAGVPLRTLEDWRAGRRTPAKYVQETILAKAKEM